jgi:hypothetical protein
MSRLSVMCGLVEGFTTMRLMKRGATVDSSPLFHLNREKGQSFSEPPPFSPSSIPKKLRSEGTQTPCQSSYSRSSGPTRIQKSRSTKSQIFLAHLSYHSFTTTALNLAVESHVVHLCTQLCLLKLYSVRGGDRCSCNIESSSHRTGFPCPSRAPQPED